MTDLDLSTGSNETKMAASGRPLGAISTLISLFLLLLVFFILLFSVTQARRSQAGSLIASMDAALKGIPSIVGMAPLASRQSDSDNPAQFAQSVSQLITGFGPSQESLAGKVAAGDTLISLGIPAIEIFLPDSAVLTPHAEAVALKLAVLLQRRPSATQHYHLRFHVPSTMVNGKDNEAGIPFGRVASFAAILYRDGCPANRLTVSVDRSGNEGQVYFEFSMTGQPEDAG